MVRMQAELADAAVVAQVVAGDRDAYGVLVQRHSRSLFSVAYRVTDNEQDAEEVVQEAFLKAYKSLHRFESRSNFGTWLYRIAMNTALDLVGKRKNALSVAITEDPEPDEQAVQLVSDRPTQEQEVFSGQVSGKIAKAMNLLTETERAAFVMRHMEGRSTQEIAEVLNMKENAAKNSVFRAVQKLRRQLEPLVSTR